MSLPNPAVILRNWSHPHRRKSAAFRRCCMGAGRRERPFAFSGSATAAAAGSIVGPFVPVNHRERDRCIGIRRHDLIWQWLMPRHA